MLESMIDSAAVSAESPATTHASESPTLSPAGLVESETNNHSHRGFRLWQAIRVRTTETFHGGWTCSSELVTLKSGLKPYHMNRLQEAQQQLFAEAPGAISLELVTPSEVE